MEAFQQVQNLISPKLTYEVFETVLKKQSNSDNVKLISITLGTDTTRNGDSFLSTVLRFSVEYSGESSGSSNIYKLHVISKSLLKNIARRKTYRNSDFFPNEIIFYEQVWPELDAFQRELKPSQLFEEIPNYLCGDFDGTNDYVLLEDLSFQGYQTLGTSDQVTLERAKLVLKMISRFHALGYAFKGVKPELFYKTASKLKETYFHEDFRSWYSKYQELLNSITMDAVEQELPEVYGNRLKKIFARDIYGEAVKLCSSSTKSKFDAIGHGDTWMPNILTRYDESKKPVHSVLIDFQLARCSSIAKDLHIFIYSCTDANLRVECYEAMMKYCCQEFNAFLSQLCPKLSKNGDVLTYDALMDELKADGIFALIMSIEANIMSLLDDDEVFDLDKLEGEDAVSLESVILVTNLKTKEKRLRLANVIKHMMDYNFI